MSFSTGKTFKELTAPGYFNFSKTQKPITGKISRWFNNALAYWSNQLNMFDSFFRLWNTHDYTTATISRTPYVAYLLRNWGLGFFLGSDTQAVALLGYVQISYPKSTAENILGLFAFLAEPPLEWSIGVPQIVYGHQVPTKFAETLIIFHTGGAPATPAPSEYVPRDWDAPSGWTLDAVSATYYSRGYLSDVDEITWMTPQSTSVSTPFYDVELLADLPASPATASLGGVFDDGTGDQGAIYYYDGAVWRKTTTPNENQGEIGTGGVIPNPKPRAVFAPVVSGPAVVSETKPPADGPTQGFGMYTGLSSGTLRAREIDVSIVLTPDGKTNLGVIVNLLRRIKPTLNSLLIFYTVDGVPNSEAILVIKDSAAL